MTQKVFYGIILQKYIADFRQINTKHPKSASVNHLYGNGVMRMSSQSNSSVYSEKKIAAYEAMFKESSFAKPQEVYLTITVAHLFGQAYIMEQQGTKEGDPVYSRFVCPLEEITKVYINENAKSSPLFIQCDTDVKGVVHRKRIIVPCLDNVASIVSQIKEVQAAHMEKVNAALEREKQRKLRELEEKRKEEQAASRVNAAIPPLSAVEKLPDPEPVKAVNITAPAPVPTPAPEKADKKNVEYLNNEIAESMKALESFEKVLSSSPAKEAAPEKPALDLDSIPDKAEAVPAPAPAPVPAPVAEPAPVKEEVPVQEVKPVQATIQPEPVAPVEEKPVQPAAAPAPVKAAPRVNPNGKPSALSDFETEVRKLKALKDEGKITAEEYAAQKKKLVSELY